MVEAHTSEGPEVAPIRPGEEFDQVAVEAYLKERIPGLEGKMEALQFPGGHANLTYLVRFGERELVLRRPPLGPVAPRSHDMAREYRVLSKLAGHYPQAPRAYAFCDDPSIMGAVFIVMERCRGSIIRSSVPAAIDRHPDGRRRASLALIEAMAAFHDLGYVKLGLSDLGKPEGFVARQVHGWKGRWDRAKNVEVPQFDEMYRWLVENMPSSPQSTLVHNDLKLDNVMIDPDDPDRVTAVLDWDMTTLGDPLIDLGTLLGYWAEADDPPARGATAAVTAQPGFPTRAEISERYAELRGIQLTAIPWYEAFAHWKTAVVLQQIYIRFVRGQTQDARFEALGNAVPMLVRIASEVAERAEAERSPPGAA
jgi:aminoglycoside phosphotransferase (APT) family kinase protein